MSSINSLEYNDIRNSIVNFIQQDPYFKDFNFDASNISRIVNMLAYASMYNGYYMKMLLDESMPDSARTKTALIGHANSRNYLTKFIAASKAIIKVSVDADEINKDDIPYIQISKGQQFKGVNKDGKSVYFIAPYDVSLLYNETLNQYTAEEFMLMQGQYRTQTYNVIESFKKYQITDVNCDDTTITVRVKSNKNATQATEYVRNHDFYDVSENDLCYYITASTNGIYQIHFGHNIFGREPRPSEVIEITYIKTDGSISNDTSKFDLVLGKKPDTPPTNINYYSSNLISIKTEESSSGGLDAETIDELRFGILNFTRQRGRAITSDDIKSVILAEFRDIESINVWSGGTAKYRQYGKTYISIKPKTGELLTNAAKKVITDLMVNRFGIMSKTDLVFIDPNFTDVLLDVRFRIDRNKTNDNSATFKASIEKAVSTFNKEVLSKFDVNYYDTDLTNYVKNINPAITTVYTQKLIQKTLVLNYGNGRFQIDFGNTLRYITSSEFAYGNLTCKLKQKDDRVLIIDTDNNMVANIGTVNLEKGTLDIILPQYVSTELLHIIGEPIYPDITTLEDNIVRIKTINVTEAV